MRDDEGVLATGLVSAFLSADTPAARKFDVPADLPDSVRQQIEKLKLPLAGTHVFQPRLVMNRKGKQHLERQAVAYGPKEGVVGYLDEQGRIWIKDRAHSGIPDHWDVQIDGGMSYFRVGLDGEEIP
ncbi:MAG: hypothetical protein IT428_32145 [Planctomycetaceae bacterium]|nr:hypothetical protein [Planctomycetaceae bacterium]